MSRAIDVFSFNDYPTEDDGYMMLGSSIICLHLSFEFIDFLGDTDRPPFEIERRSRISGVPQDTCNGNCNGKGINSLGAACNGNGVESFPIDRAPPLTTDNTGMRYLFPLLLFIWNVRSLFANGLDDTWRYVMKLIDKYDVGILAETRSTTARHKVLLTHLPSSLLLFSSGVSVHYGGVAILIKKQFILAGHFTEVRDKVIEKGRCIKLSLSGAGGKLHIFGIYLDPNNSQARIKTMKLMKRAVSQNVHTIIGGDLNFTFKPNERLSFGGATPLLASTDSACSCAWDELFTADAFVEIDQAGFTCRHSHGYSKIDKVFSNMHLGEGVAMEIACNTLSHPVYLSDHHPVGIRFQQRRPAGGKVANWIAEQPGFENEVFGYLDGNVIPARCHVNPFGYLMEVKNAIYKAASFFKHKSSIEPAISLEHRMNVTANFIRSMMAQDLASARRFQTSYAFLTSVDVKKCCEGAQYVEILDHFVDLSQQYKEQQSKKEELRRQAAILDGVCVHDDSMFSGCVHDTLNGMATKSSGSVAAVSNSTGEIVTEDAGIADVLNDHWQDVFQKLGVDLQLARDLALESEGFLESSLKDVFPVKDDARTALKHSPNTGVGPDGIPYNVYRALGEFAVELIMIVLTFMLSINAEIPEWFNLAFMAFIPKDATGYNAYGVPFFSPECTRPLSLADTFNKLLANTVRIALERFASSRITFYQRGFLRGRQILDNVVELDHFSHIFSIASRSAAIFLFDFSAAFPSVSHIFLWMVLENAGLPTALVRLIRCFYRSCRHIIRLGGRRFPGPHLRSGVRQGCPLSGLLFAIVMEPILRKISRSMGPHGCLRAYADDIGAVVRNYVVTLAALGMAFDFVGAATGLYLNIKKTVFIPLWPVADFQSLRRMIQELWPKWGNMTIADHGKYLGFMMGPGGARCMWAKALGKAQARADDWSRKHPGMMFTVLAHNQYIASVLSYIGQLVPPSSEVVRCFEKMIYQLFPGPGNWITPAIARNLELFGFPCQLVDPQVVSSASMLRYYSQTALHIDDLAVEMFLKLQAYRNSGEMRNEFLNWHEGAFTLNLMANVGTCQQNGVRISNIRFHDESRWKPQPGLQQLLSTNLLRTKYCQAGVTESLRKRLKRWKLAVNLRCSVDLAIKHLQTLGKKNKPSIQAAYLRTLCNGWCTQRRFRTHANSILHKKICLMGCGARCDSIEHYAHCDTLLTFFTSVGLNNYMPSITNFLMIQCGLSPERISLHGRCLYAVYISHGILRHTEEPYISVERVRETLRAAFQRSGNR